MSHLQVWTLRPAGSCGKLLRRFHSATKNQLSFSLLILWRKLKLSAPRWESWFVVVSSDVWVARNISKTNMVSAMKLRLKCRNQATVHCKVWPNSLILTPISNRRSIYKMPRASSNHMDSTHISLIRSEGMVSVMIYKPRLTLICSTAKSDFEIFLNGCRHKLMASAS